MRVIAWNRSGVPDGLPCAGGRARRAAAHRRRGLAAPGAQRGDPRLHRRPPARPAQARRDLHQHRARRDRRRGGAGRGAAGAAASATPGSTCSPTEPLPAGHPLTRLPNVTLTAHAAFATREASERLLRFALEILAEERAARLRLTGRCPWPGRETPSWAGRHDSISEAASAPYRARDSRGAPGSARRGCAEPFVKPGMLSIASSDRSVA